MGSNLSYLWATMGKRGQWWGSETVDGHRSILLAVPKEEETFKNCQVLTNSGNTGVLIEIFNDNSNP